MIERVFNLYLIIEDEIIRGVAARPHDLDMSEPEMIEFLQANATPDLGIAQRFPLPDRYVLLSPHEPVRSSGLRYQSFLELAEAGQHLGVFEVALQALEGPAEPLFCITPVVDGKPRIDSLVES